MKPEILRKFSKEELITFHLRQVDSLEFYRKKLEKQEKVGQISIKHKIYNVIFEREE